MQYQPENPEECFSIPCSKCQFRYNSGNCLRPEMLKESKKLNFVEVYHKLP